MRFKELLNLGELFEIQYKDTTVRTMLQEIVSDTEFVVMQPTFRGVPLQAEDEDVTFTFYRRNGCHQFQGRLSAPYQKNDIMLCRAVRVSEVKRIQRRQYYRLPVVLDVFLYELDDIGEPHGKRHRAKTKELSEKSMAVSCFAGFAEETLLAAEIMLSDTEKVLLRAGVLQCHEPSQPDAPYDIVLLFTDYHEKDRELIRRYIFNKQVQLRKKGMQ